MPDWMKGTREMVRLFSIICAGLILLSSGLCFAEDGKADRQLVRTLMQKSGLSKQIEQIPATMQADIVRASLESDNPLSQGEIDDLSRKTAEAFNASILKDTVETYILGNLSEKDIRMVLAWVDSPLGEKISRLEEEASTPAAYQKIQKMAAQKIKKTKRSELLSKLDDAIKATDAGVNIAVNMQVAFLLAVTAEMPADQRLSVEDILSEVNKDRTQLRQTIERETMAGFLYAYQSLTDSEIKKYILFAESEPGKKYHAVSAKGLNTALMQAGLALGSKFEQGVSNDGKGSF
jgi:hypothetical protein